MANPPTNFSYILSFRYFFRKWLSQLTLASYGSYYFYLWFSPFLCFVLAFLWIDWRRMKIVNKCQSRPGKFVIFFVVCSLQKPTDLKKICLSCSVFLFSKNDEILQCHFSSAWASSTSAKLFFSQKYKRNIFDLLKCTSIDFVRLYIYIYIYT